MTIFFTSDTHFGHTNIIKFANRPFADVDDMNEGLVTRWNSVVTNSDEVWHLGDFSFNHSEHFFHRLNGIKHLIIGNHDRRSTLTLPWASQPRYYNELRIVTEDKIDHNVILFHYPIEEWDGFYHGAIHLHGHVHGKKMKPCDRVRIDVAVECFDYKPVTLDQILATVHK